MIDDADPQPVAAMSKSSWAMLDSEIDKTTLNIPGNRPELLVKLSINDNFDYDT